MSHLRVASDVKIKDLDTLQEALKPFPKFKLKENCNKHYHYGGNYAPCEHAISMVGTDYEIGLIKKKDEEGEDYYALQWDSDAYQIYEALGKDGGKLSAEYNKCLYEKWARDAWYMVAQEEDSEDIILKLTAPTPAA